MVYTYNMEKIEQKQLNSQITKKDAPKVPFKQWLTGKTQTILDVFNFAPLTIYYEGEASKHKIEGKGSVIFTVKYVKQYRTAYIKYYGSAIEAYNRGDFKLLVDALIHELLHLYTVPLVDAAVNRFVTEREIYDISEEATESLAFVMRRLLNKVTPELYK